MEITAAMVKELREKTGAGVMDCKKILLQTVGDMEKASQLLREKGLDKLEKKSDRVASQGLVEAYVHFGNRLGTMVEVNCETDFVANTPEFKELAHNLALQITAAAPQFVSREELPEGSEADPEKVCLLQQKFIKDESKTIKDIIGDTVARVGEKISVRRFVRFELGK